MTERTPIDPVDFHFQQILESERLGHKKSKISTSQGAMVALALADRRFAETGLREQSVEKLHERLDAPQLAALKRFRDERKI